MTLTFKNLLDSTCAIDLMQGFLPSLCDGVLSSHRKEAPAEAVYREVVSFHK